MISHEKVLEVLAQRGARAKGWSGPLNTRPLRDGTCENGTTTGEDCPDESTFTASRPGEKKSLAVCDRHAEMLFLQGYELTAERKP